MKVACGVDLSRKSLVASIYNGRSFETREFEVHDEGYERFKEWLRQHKCREVAMESTGVLWTPL